MSDTIYEHTCPVCGNVWRSDQASEKCDKCQCGPKTYTTNKAEADGAEAFGQIRRSVSHEPVRIGTFPKALIDAGQRLMREEYARQKSLAMVRDARRKLRKLNTEPCHHGLPIRECESCSTLGAQLYRIERDYERRRYRRLEACYIALWIVFMVLVVLYAMDWRLR